MAIGGTRTASKKRRRMIRMAMRKTRKVPRTSVTYKKSVAPATIMMNVNVNAPVSTRPTRRAAMKAIERISQVVNTKKAREAERAVREEVAAEEAARKARAAERKAAAAEKKAIEAEKKEFTRPIGTRGESVANITEMFTKLPVPSSEVNNSGSPVPVYRTGRKLSPVAENY